MSTEQKPQPLPAGWRVQRNSDGSIGLFGPMPKQGECGRTSHCLYAGDRGDLAEITRRLLEHALSA